MITAQTAKTVTNLLENTPPRLATPLAMPWHYRRNGRYYLRFRTIRRPFGTLTVSLRTTDRASAMAISSNIQRALAYVQLDKPEATWEELRTRLLAIAHECLELAHGNAALDFAHSDYFEEMYDALRAISKQGELSFAQHKAVAIGQSVMAAANARIEGRSGTLVTIIDELTHNQPNCGAPTRQPVEPSLRPVCWEELSELYLSEQTELKDSSKKATKTNHTVIGRAIDAIGLSDLRLHTREDMLALRTHLLTEGKGREKSTVNNLIAKLQAVMTWAVRMDKLAKQYTDKLKFTKDADSSRITFTRTQVVSIMTHVNKLPTSSWERWALSTLAVTGARVGEISYLTKADVRQVDGYWCVDINEDDIESNSLDETSDGVKRKSIKNKYSKRLVPLVDGALGFDLPAFLRAVESGALPSNHDITPARASQALNRLLKKILGDSKSKHQTLHSLRHHVLSSMQAAGISTVYAQATAGQSTGALAYDGYGSGVPVSKVHATIKKALMEDMLDLGEVGDPSDGSKQLLKS